MKVDQYEYEAYLTKVANAASKLAYAKAITDIDPEKPPSAPSPSMRDAITDLKIASDLNSKTTLTDPSAKETLFTLTEKYEVVGCADRNAFEKACRQKTTKVIIEEVQNAIVSKLINLQQDIAAGFELLRILLFLVQDVAEGLREETPFEELEDILMTYLHGEDSDEDELEVPKPLSVVAPAKKDK